MVTLESSSKLQTMQVRTSTSGALRADVTKAEDRILAASVNVHRILFLDTQRIKRR